MHSEVWCGVVCGVQNVGKNGGGGGNSSSGGSRCTKEEEVCGVKMDGRVVCGDVWWQQMKRREEGKR